MGLDVYVKRCENREAAKALEEQYERESNAIWKAITGDRKYDECTDSEKDSARAQTKALAERLGLGEWGEYPGIETIEVPSAKYPEHYFKVGYFRSSYNGSGINSVLSRLDLPSLGEIMGAGDEYDFVPDWTACITRARDALERLRKADTSYDVMEIAANNMFKAGPACKSEKAAREIYAKTIATPRAADWQSFSNSEGHFYLDGLKVRAFIEGTGSFNQPCLFVVYDKKDADWYTQALEIVIETCEYVLSRPDPQNYYMCWSG